MRPQPSRHWRWYRAVSCPVCRTFWQIAPARFARVWFIACYDCGVQQWRAR